MAFTGFVIFERQENEAKEVAGQALNTGVTVSASKAKTAENSARWSGSIELAKIVKVETSGTALEARNAVAAAFPGSATGGMVSVAEGNFLETP